MYFGRLPPPAPRSVWYRMGRLRSTKSIPLSRHSDPACLLVNCFAVKHNQGDHFSSQRALLLRRCVGPGLYLLASSAPRLDSSDVAPTQTSPRILTFVLHTLQQSYDSPTLFYGSPTVSYGSSTVQPTQRRA